MYEDEEEHENDDEDMLEKANLKNLISHLFNSGVIIKCSSSAQKPECNIKIM